MKGRVFCLWLSLVAAGQAGATTRVVRPDGLGDYPDIQSAIQASVNGDIVLLAPGTFTGPGNRDLDYHGKAITVRSSSDDPQACIIDCQRLGRGLVMSENEGPQSILRGVTLANGAPNSLGAGVYLHQCGPTFVRCVFSGDSASLGGAIYT